MLAVSFRGIGCLCLLLAVGCRRPKLSATDAATLAAAESLVRQFVTADTLGDLDGARALFIRADGDTPGPCDFAYDVVEIARSVLLKGSLLRNDTAIVVIEFNLLGGVTSEDPHTAGPKYLRFHPYPRIEDDSIAATHEATGKLGIVCNPAATPNRRGLSLWQTKLAYLDDSSLALWRSLVPARTAEKR